MRENVFSILYNLIYIIHINYRGTFRVPKSLKKAKNKNIIVIEIKCLISLLY